MYGQNAAPAELGTEVAGDAIAIDFAGATYG
jgi:hypothetical protein